MCLLCFATFAFMQNLSRVGNSLFGYSRKEERGKRKEGFGQKKTNDFLFRSFVKSDVSELLFFVTS